MPTFKGRIKGTFEDDFEVEADTEVEAAAKALLDWRYVEFVDLEVDSIREVDDDGSTA